MSDLAKQLIEENLQTKNPILDLGKCGLDGTEKVLDRLAECTHLETLIFSNEWIDFDSSTIISSNNSGKENYLTQLPDSLPHQLQSLIAGGYGGLWEVSDLKPFVYLKQLRDFNLSASQLSDVEVLGELKELERLNLNANKLSDIH